MQVTINNKPYEIFCGEGEEDKLSHASEELNKRVIALKKASPNAGHEMLLAMSALILQDELNDQIITENDPNIKIADALDSISGYVEKLVLGLK